MTPEQDRGDDFTPAAAAATDAAAAATDAAAAATDAAAAAEELKIKDGEQLADDKPRDDKGRFIPKERFDEAVQRERDRAAASEARVAELESALKSRESTANAEKIEAEITELEKAHAKAIVDGDLDAAAEAMKNIRHKERLLVGQNSTQMSEAATAQLREEMRVDAVIDALYETYAVLNPEKEEYDQDIADLVLAAQASLIQNERMTPSAALRAAAAKVMAKVGSPSRDGGKAAGLEAANRRATPVEKNVAAAKAQPASARDVGADTDKAGQKGAVDASNLTIEDLNALPPEAIARMRGDMV